MGTRIELLMLKYAWFLQNEGTKRIRTVFLRKWSFNRSPRFCPISSTNWYRWNRKQISGSGGEYSAKFKRSSRMPQPIFSGFVCFISQTQKRTYGYQLYMFWNQIFFQSGLMRDEDMRRYHNSVIETECTAGIMQRTGKTKNSCAIFLREIKNINLQDSRGGTT